MMDCYVVGPAHSKQASLLFFYSDTQISTYFTYVAGFALRTIYVVDGSTLTLIWCWVCAQISYHMIEEFAISFQTYL